MGNKKNWFANWFDSPYYHLLYQNRDFTEAENFIQNLMTYLNMPKQESKILDLACGRGRHSVHLNNMGYNVLGVDLSRESIEKAKKFSKDNLAFKKTDMRDLPFENEFNLILNLFTSFGYFLQEGDNRKVISSAADALKVNGIFVLDYLNVEKTLQLLPVEEEIQRGEVLFKINKQVEDQFIVKDISFISDGDPYHFKEYVKCLRLKDFEAYFQQNNLKLVDVFGDYHLNDFEINTSERLVLVAEKIK